MCQSIMPVGHLSKPKSFVPFTLSFLKQFYGFSRPEELPCCARSYAWQESRWHQLNIVVLYQLRGCYLETCFNCSFRMQHFQLFASKASLQLLPSNAPLKFFASEASFVFFQCAPQIVSLQFYHFQLFASNEPLKLFASNASFPTVCF